MKHRVFFKQKDDRTELYLSGEWEEKVELKLNAADLKRLGKSLIWLGWRFRRSFNFKAEEAGLTVYAKRKLFRGRPLLRFEFVSTHPLYNVPCDNRFNYYEFTLKELKAFGKELIAFEKSGFAAL